MRQCANLPAGGGSERERAYEDVYEADCFLFSNGREISAARQQLTRVQIEALVSGEFSPMYLGPELVQRLNCAWNCSGQRLHMLHVEVVKAPIECPRCGDWALYRTERRGFLQLKVYPLLGVYPWSCVSCHKSTLLRMRSTQCEVSDDLRVNPKAEPVHEEAT